MNAKHTPGPWEHIAADDPRGQPVPYYRGLICLISTDPYQAVVAKVWDTVEVEEWPANAALIAAAPELLLACKKLAELLNCYEVALVAKQTNGTTAAQFMAEASAAIAKAEGK